MPQLVDPTNETRPPSHVRAARPASLAGLTIGLLDISKSRGDVFLDEVHRQLTKRGHTTRRYTKLSFAHPASVELQQQIALECDAVLEALAD